VRWIAVVATVCIAAPARADTAEQLQAKGEQLAKLARYPEAIAAFKQADAIEPRASHACLIALAYLRGEAWPQAEIFLARCHARATAEDPLPDWVPEAEKLIAQKVATARVAEVDIAVDPPGIDAKVQVSTFPQDEAFEPRKIHLPFGHHTIVASANGYITGQQDIDITDATPQRIAIVLHRPAEVVTVQKEGTHPAGHAPSRLPRDLMIAGAITFGAGLVSYGVMGLSWYELDSTKSSSTYRSYSTSYDVSKYATIGLWTAGVGMFVTGYLLHRSHDEAPIVSITPRAGGGVLSLEWSR